MAISEDLLVSVEIDTGNSQKNIDAIVKTVNKLEKEFEKLAKNDFFKNNIKNAVDLSKKIESANKSIMNQSKNNKSIILDNIKLNKQAQDLVIKYEKIDTLVDASTSSYRNLGKELGLSTKQAKELLGVLEVAAIPELVGDSEAKFFTDELIKLAHESENTALAMKLISAQTAEIRKEFIVSTDDVSGFHTAITALTIAVTSFLSTSFGKRVAESLRDMARSGFLEFMQDSRLAAKGLIKQIEIFGIRSERSIMNFNNLARSLKITETDIQDINKEFIKFTRNLGSKIPHINIPVSISSMDNSVIKRTLETQFISAAKHISNQRDVVGVFDSIFDEIDTTKISSLGDRISSSLGKSLDVLKKSFGDPNIFKTYVSNFKVSDEEIKNGILQLAMVINRTFANLFKLDVIGDFFGELIFGFIQGTQNINLMQITVTELKNKIDNLGSSLKKIPDFFVNIGKSISLSLSAPFINIADKINEFTSRAKQNFLSFSAFVKSNMSISVVGALETLSLIGPVFEFIGTKMKDSENALVSFTGKLLYFSGVVTNTIIDGLRSLVTGIGKVSVSLGDKLINSTANAAESFKKYETVINRFNFSINGVNNTFGEAATGGVKDWNRVLKELNDTTTFSREEIAKSIKLLVLEGSQLGISFDENIKIIKSSADIASATGDQLTDTVGKVISAFNGEATALANLGFNLTKTGLSHSDMQKKMGLTLEQMSEQEILSLRINELFKQTRVVSGAAANELETIEGAQKALNKTYNDTLVVLGRSAVVTRQYILLKTKLLQILNSFPEPLISFFGYIKDILGVFLKLTGEILQVTFGLLSFLTVLKLINFALSVTFGVTISLSQSLGFLLKSVLPVVAGFIILKEAFDQLYEESSAFRDIIDEITGANKNLQNETEKSISMLDRLSNVFQGVISTVKLALIGFTQLVVTTQIAIVNLRKSWDGLFNQGEDVVAYEMLLNQLETNLWDLTNQSEKLHTAFIDLIGSGEAYADTADEMSNKTDILSNKFDEWKSNVIDIAKTINKDFSSSALRVSILGDEFDKAAFSVAQAESAIENVFKSGKNREQAGKDLAQENINLLTKQLELSKLQNDKLSEFDKIRIASSIKELEDSGKLVEAEKIKQNEILKTFEQQVKGIEKLGKLNINQINNINKTRISLNNQASSAIQAAREQELKRAQEAADKIIARNERLDAILNSNLQLKIQINENDLDSIALLEEKGRLVQKDLERKMQAVGISKLEIKALQEQAELQEKLTKKEIDKQKNIHVEQIISDSTLDRLKTAIGEGTSGFAKKINDAVGSMAGIVSVIKDSISAMISFAQGLIDFIPQILDGIAGIFTSLTALPNKIFESLSGVYDGITEFISDFIPNLITAVGDILESTIDFLIEGLPAAIESLFDMLPDVLISLLDRLPYMVEKLVIGLINVIPRIAIALVDFIVKDAPRIAIKLVEVIAIELPKAIVRGIILGADELVRRLTAFFSGKNYVPKEITDFGKNMSEGISNLARNIARETSNVFKVLDLDAEARAASMDPTESIKKAIRGINEILKDFLKFLKKAWMWIWDNILEPIYLLLKKAWMWVWDNVIEPIAKLLKDAWMWVWDTIIDPMASVIKDAWTWVWDTIIDPMASVIKDAWMWVWDNTIQPLFDGIKKVWNIVYQNVLRPFILSISNAFNLINDQIFKPLTNIVQNAFQPIMEFFGSIFKLNIKDAFEGVWVQFSGLGSAIWEGIKSGINAIGNIFKNIFDSSSIETAFRKLGTIIGDSITSVVKSLFNPLIDVLNNLKIPKVEVGGKVLGKSFSFTLIPDIDLIPGDIKKFASGGLVGGSGTGDTVPSLLTPGEYVINRGAVNSLGAQFLGRMNATGQVQSGGSQIFNMEINVNVEASSQSLNETYVRNKLMPAIKDEFKKSSLRGEFLLSDRGLRKT